MGDIDFTNADSRMTYLKDNLGHLMNGIDSNYGQVLMDELMRRMEATVRDFNEEVKAMLGQLQGIKPIPRDNILASARHPEPKAAPIPHAAPEPPTTELKPAPPVVEPESTPEYLNLVQTLLNWRPSRMNLTMKRLLQLRKWKLKLILKMRNLQTLRKSSGH